MIITADSHFHQFTQYNLRHNSAINSRLAVTIDVHNQMLEYAKSVGDHLIVINGDIYETKHMVEAVTNNEFHDWIMRARDQGVSIILNVGNHDMALTGQEHVTLLHPFDSLPHVIVCEEPTILDHTHFGGLANCVFIPYRRNPKVVAESITKAMEKLKANPAEYWHSAQPMNLLFHHGAILGAKLSNREFMDASQAIEVSALRPDYFDYVFLGHFHRRQKLAENVMYTGSPLAHDLNDANQQHGFYHFDLEACKLKFVPTNHPKFFKLEIKSKEDLNVAWLKGNYYQLVVTTPDVTVDDVRGLDPAHVRVRFEQQPRDRPAARLAEADLNAGEFNILDTFAAYTKAHAEQHAIKPEDVTQTILDGVKLIKEAQQP